MFFFIASAVVDKTCLVSKTCLTKSGRTVARVVLKVGLLKGQLGGSSLKYVVTANETLFVTWHVRQTSNLR